MFLGGMPGCLFAFFGGRWNHKTSNNVLRHLVPCLAFQQPAGEVFARAPPLLEEEWDLFLDASIADVDYPVGIHGPGVRPAFPADYHPIDAIQVYAIQWSEQRFAGKEPDVGRDRFEVLDASDDPHVLDAGADPYVLRPGQLGGEFLEASRPFREDLEAVPVGIDHALECLFYEADRDVFMEKVAHRVHEDAHRLFPG